MGLGDEIFLFFLEMTVLRVNGLAIRGFFVFMTWDITKNATWDVLFCFGDDGFAG